MRYLLTNTTNTKNNMKEIKTLLDLSINYTENRKSLQDSKSVKKEYECLCNSFTEYIDETRSEYIL